MEPPPRTHESDQERSDPSSRRRSLPPGGPRHIIFAVDDIQATLARLQAQGAELVGAVVNYEDSYWLCYLRGPAGIIVKLAEEIDQPL